MMRPRPLNELIRRRMRATKRRDTRPERELRSLLYQDGLRFRVDRVPMVGLRCRADVVFARARTAVFVNGCFWHGCPHHATWPKNNAKWWRAKLEANRARDSRVDTVLRAAGWKVFRVWEHEDMTQAARKIAKAVRARG
jgi:DNA mismatch endonuclease (patch repair protein)